MFNREETENIKNTVWKILNFDCDDEVTVLEKDGVYACRNGSGLFVGGKTRAMLARAFMLLAKNISENKQSFEIFQKPKFESCGVMLDVSRNGVMKTDAVKKYLDYMAANGLNLFMLYTEDVYELKGYEYFGYMRGRYSEDELREIDDYAYALGIEVVPCVQLLGHLEQYFKWHEGDDFKDTKSILMIGNEKSYEFIETIISTLRRCFRSARVHIGMDEAHDVGLGNYLRVNGYHNRFDIINNHLQRILEICRKYDFSPMMWSDMFFRLGSKTGDYYDLDCVIPEDKVENIPDVELVYWDYYHTDIKFYDKMLEIHETMKKPVVFGGAVWTWDGFLPNFEFTLKASAPALEACRNRNVKTVLATMWEDDGCETNHMLSLPGLSVFGENCYSEDTPTAEEIKEAAAFITGIDSETFDMMSVFHNGENGDVKAGKRFIWCDILYNLTEYRTEPEKLCADYKKAYDYFEQHTEIRFARYAALLFRTAREKCGLLANLRRAYKEGDFQYLKDAVEKYLPELKSDYKELHAEHKKQWYEVYKAFGWEVLDGRYGTMIARIDHAIERISAYINGEINNIEELDEEPKFPEQRRNGFFSQLTTSTLIW